MAHWVITTILAAFPHGKSGESGGDERADQTAGEGGKS
eukprot:CAMPEP_0172576686 /NCGR_PEP_ID=MMETSP1067-20121228/137851_1 /TAXON_ID=265564 ORGANISM="Thalassiosira punctigera, Strain Tpunct2005C2" /NCGR_SAMPLE_ID=MMETSP1067 /ASSEMBLY_ACC=CAM_ASM_000444 /LENGTH=37 /DNA_ID= /DNA_START= /DNA_END= /DNA_ORIENTATION=